MYQNIVALHAANGMLDKDADATQNCVGSSLLLAQLRVGVLVTLARLLRRDVNLITTVIRFNASIAEIDTNIYIDKPIHLRWKLLFQHGVIVIVPTQGATKKNDTLVREGHDRIFQRMLFFFPL